MNSLCLCGCGKYPKFGNKYVNGHNNLKHGLQNTRLYHIWEAMKSRCNNLNNKKYKDYGGRGITVCDEWLEFIPFRDCALNNGYTENLQILSLMKNSILIVINLKSSIHTFPH